MFSKSLHRLILKAAAMRVFKCVQAETLFTNRHAFG
jgi:hypothetical protein